MAEQQRSVDEVTLEKETNGVLEKVSTLLSGKGIYPNEVQKQMLFSHVKAMVLRSHTGEPLPEVDISLFDEISPMSLKLAEQVVSWFDGLAYEEAHLLSVHFEVAKENELSSVTGE
ncbi:transcriptional regulator [Enterobacillus tribolii]|uniref:Transcriptional regulator n=1 Tax=Enterobacillus tribolii TaxID=1487935 RepID=A0A370QQH0_9GAMM|nr:transcriptional regulator [Enterobacillus tribolii]MBW7981654.1 transcriptional regulator [Enterobacillus tribolii]RDK91033.1 transcriptional regulator [Enterobacillus tribolii]